MSPLYPPIEPHLRGFLPEVDGHRVRYEVSGNPGGVPVLFLHGGPGSSAKPDHRRYFDPARYRIVLFDQRGCGASQPAGGVAANTTAHLVGDIERLRALLGVQRWILFGGSWGSTLALAYAQAHPQAVLRLILRGIFLASRAELDWYFNGLEEFIPEARERLFEPAPGASWAALVKTYEALLNHPDPTAAAAAAARWSAFESAVMSIGEATVMPPPAGDGAGLLARARVQVHYLAHECFLRPGELLDNVARIAHLPATLVQGRLDFVCPPRTAVALHRRWPGSRLVMVEQGRHASSHPDIERELVAAADAALA
jgi:proline iminopeptidase